MVVQHNLSAMNANRYLGINNSKLSKSLEKLSSGYAINRAGDNAAGLAVSEKMRSQIAGMTQAVKNAQDGISMVQTFEGALTETDSILQRMKTLADQMANGTYDDPVDRTAAQQEFLQLNDELDQIADTDFNGVVVLNGGVMSDGVTADKNGLIDYKAAKAAADAGTTTAAVDIYDNETADNILDNSQYGAEDAAKIWENLGLGSDVETARVTFKYDGKNWNAVAVTDENDKVIDGADASGLKTEAITSTNTGDGGFKIAGTSLNAVFDAMDTDGNGRVAAEGDIVTFEFTNPGGATYAPKNAGIKESSYAPTGVMANAKPAPKFELDAGITDGAMTQDIADALDALKDATISVNYDSGKIDTANGVITSDDHDLTFTADAANEKFTVEYKGTKLGTITIDPADVQTEAKTVTQNTQTFTNGGNGGNDQAVTVADQTLLDAATAATWTRNGAGTWTNDQDATTYNSDAAFSAALGLTLTGTFGNADKIEIAAGTVDVPAGVDTAATGTVDFQIDVDAYKAADPNATYTAKSIKTADGAKAAAAGGASVEVSKSDAFKNSEALMTYKSSIILQAGARTKDAVEFTFKYNSDAIGDLEADLNCTAKGLGTDKLNLSTQKAANYAIDKIDQAINKVSLVRGTFGAIQNRLEHKIDNLNVSVENLTSAESQIRDTNMPQEMMNFTKQQILAQASQSMLAQANQLPQGVLSLLQ